jgi:acyl-CoA dehydrogenase
MLMYEPPVADYLFLLEHVIRLDEHRHLRGYADLDPGLVATILDEIAKLSRDVLLPLNAVGDREGCKLHSDGSVTTPTGFRHAYRIYREGGWSALGVPAEHGGQDLPKVVTTAALEFSGAANQAFDMYTGWGESAAAILGAFGSEEQRAAYLPRLVSGEWSGSMALTESQAGTDIGLIRARAVRQSDGSYRVTGTKIFNSGAEHDLTDNIIHFVLARIEGAPPGVSGISLFLAPKFLFGPEGKPAQRNRISCGALEHKMGLHGNSTCVMNYDDATAWLIGEPNRGLAVMFVLMNHMRRRVGAISVGVAEIAYQNASAYVKARLQGRALSSPKNPSSPADPLIVQPDVRRTLLAIGALNDAARALVVWSALLSDIAERSPRPEERTDASRRLTFVTPVLKAFLSDVAFENCVSAQQLFGGHGYITEMGIEQLVRDIRLGMLAEGANGVQSFDLATRQLGREGGIAAASLADDIGNEIARADEDARTRGYTRAMEAALQDWQEASRWLLDRAGHREAVATGATDYLRMTGLVLLGFMWLRILAGLHRQLDSGIAQGQRLAAKYARAQFFMERLLPETRLRLNRIRCPEDTITKLAPSDF